METKQTRMNQSIDRDTDQYHHNNQSVTAAVQAGLSRTITAPLAFFFKTPLRLFRPPRVSHTAVLSAVMRAEHTSARLTPQFIRQLIKEQPSIRVFTINWILPPLLANAVVGMALFGTYEYAQQLAHLLPLTANRFSDTPNIISETLCGSLAGLAHGAIVHPLESLKTQFISSRRITADPGETQQTVYRFIRNYPYWAKNELRKLFIGVHRTIIRDSFAFGVFFGSNEWIHRWFKEKLSNGGGKEGRVERRFREAVGIVGSGLAASYLTCTILHQFDQPRSLHTSWTSTMTWLPRPTDFARGWLPMAVALFAYHLMDI